MNSLEQTLFSLNTGLYDNLEKTKNKVSKLLQTYSRNFPTYTDHSIHHTEEVMNLASQLLSNSERNLLNADEIYVLCMACILHDVGMCIPEDKIAIISETEEILNYRKINPDLPVDVYIRDIHHILSLKFIMEEWEYLDISNDKYASAIALVAQGHRKVDINDFDVYEPRFFVRTGRDFVCLPYLACIIRIADELDISNLRTPDILCKYYMPDNEISQMEWNKHKSTILVNFVDDTIFIEAKCSDHNMLSALEEQFEKIQKVINSCQKTIRSLSFLGDRSFSLQATRLEPKYRYINFDPKGIKYTFDVKNVINAFVGKDLYNNNNAAIREAIQNAIDACNYKKSIIKDGYTPQINVILSDDEIIIEDNGQGMDEFIIENYFGKLASSFYEQQEIKNDFQAIGQFGIGVFSYFLISDYIDIETKRKGKSGLKFRTDQDPNGYFHFFEHFEKQDEGTKLVLHLKDEFKKNYQIDFLDDFINKSFPYIDINITLTQSLESVLIIPKNFDLDFDNDVLPKMYHRSHDFKSKLKLFYIVINNGDFQGSLGLLVPKTKSFNELKLNRYFDHSNFKGKGATSYSEIQVSQKGVFISNYTGGLQFLIGKVNTIKKLNINLNRSAFRNAKDIKSIIEYFETELINELFSSYLPSIKIRDKKDLARFTRWFLDNNWGYSFENHLPERKLALISNFYYPIHVNDIINYFTLKDIDENFNEIYLVTEFNLNVTNVKEYNYMRISIQNYWEYDGFFTRFLSYALFVDEISEEYFLVYRKIDYEKFVNVRKYFQWSSSLSFSICILNSDKIAVNITDKTSLSKKQRRNFEFYDNIYFNVNSDFVKTALANYDVIGTKSSFNNFIKEICEMINEYLSFSVIKENKQIVIDRINNLITKLNYESVVKFDPLTLLDI